MRKRYRISENVRVEFFCDAENTTHAINQYLKHFQSKIGVNDAIEIVDSDDFVSQTLINGRWVDADEEMEDIVDKVFPIPPPEQEVDTPPTDDVEGVN